jgi:hypothetical protein
MQNKQNKHYQSDFCKYKSEMKNQLKLVLL